MGCRRRAGIVAAAVLYPLTAFAAPAAGVPFRLTDGGGVIVPVFTGGRGPWRFLVDTGAEASTVSDALARRLDLAPVAQVRVLTPAGVETRPVVSLSGVSVGDAAAETVLASVAGPDRLRIDGRDADGILGQDFLSRFDFTIDYRRRILAFGPAAAGGNDVRLALHRDAGRLLVDLPQPGDAPALRFVPDSGTSALVVFERSTPSSLAMERLDGRAAVESLSGASRAVEMRRVPRLRVGSATLRDQVAAVVPRPEETAAEGDGLLPLHHFASVTFEKEALIVRGR
jgi:hypothetical protein